MALQIFLVLLLVTQTNDDIYIYTNASKYHGATHAAENATMFSDTSFVLSFANIFCTGSALFCQSFHVGTGKRMMMSKYDICHMTYVIV